MCSRPSSSARSRPRSLGTSTGRCRPSSPRSAISSAASASCGTHVGWTKLVASTIGRPAATRRRTNSAFTSTGTIAFSFCRPSRGTDLVDRDRGRESVGADGHRQVSHRSASTVKSAAPSLTRSPAAAPTEVTVPANGRLERELHLHRLHHSQRLTLGHVLALGDVDREDGARHRREEGAVAGGGRVVGERVGPLPHPPLAAVDDVDEVALHVEHRVLGPAVDDQVDGVVLRPTPCVRRGCPAADATAVPVHDHQLVAEDHRVGGGLGAHPPAVGPPRTRACPPCRAAPRSTRRRPAPATASGAGTSWWSSQAVSMVASRNSSDAASARRKPVLVVMPRIAVSPRASTSAARAASRSVPHAMTLPSIGS